MRRHVYTNPILRALFGLACVLALAASSLPTPVVQAAKIPAAIAGAAADVQVFIEPAQVFYQLDTTVEVRWEVRDKSGKVLDNVPARLTWPAGAEPTGEPNTFRLTRLGHQMFFVVVDPDAKPPLGSSGLVTVVEDVSGLEERDPDLDIPYVPTNMAVVDAMLEFAKVQADDIVYDLGCGDGRLFVTAAARHGAGAVGVDLDARRIADSRARAKEEGVTERVRFYHADLFQTDFPEASVLLMYLLPSVNRALRPRILRQMRPGSRVVSHDFDMGDWEPDGHREVIVRELDHHVFFWRVPAWVEGRWLGETEQAKRTFRVRLNLSQEYQKVSGTITWGDHTSEIDLARLTGTQFEFHASVPWSGTVDRVHVVGEVDGDTFTGTVARAADEARAVTAPITIRRIAAPATPSYALD